MIFPEPPPEPSAARARIRAAYRQDEASSVAALLTAASLAPAQADAIQQRARALVQAVRSAPAGRGGLDAFLQEYALSSTEGIVLMCLAEALLRIPDADTVDRLIRDKIGPADWQRHLGHSRSLLVNASTWALLLTGRLVKPEPIQGALRRLLAASSEPVIREAVRAAMRILGRQFVLGRSIDSALSRAATAEKSGYRHSYDMLGEAARSAADARRYFDSYRAAIAAIGQSVGGRSVIAAPSISIKLSALHPRYEVAQARFSLPELAETVTALAGMARAAGMGFTIDAEEADRLELSLDLFEQLVRDPRLAGWDGLGLAVQAYQTRALATLDAVIDLARESGRRLMIRLVKGAYWDSEIKRAQERGLDHYPVFTRKPATDVSYLACARRLLAAGPTVYPMFATHNALTVASVLELAGTDAAFEFQRLHGMGEALYSEIVGPGKTGIACRVYAPVGSHEDLLAYLVRRLLENGANSSFVNRLVDERAPIDEIIADPVARLQGYDPIPNPGIPLPRALYGPARPNSRGWDLADIPTLEQLRIGLLRAKGPWRACPIIGGEDQPGSPWQAVFAPADRRRQLGSVSMAEPAQVPGALALAVAAQPAWDRRGGAGRAVILERAADLFEARMPEFAALISAEGGRIIANALDELRETIDFCRYYAGEARAKFGVASPLPGPTGERNLYRLQGRGVFVCISPWNFPLAIFIGQIAAALMAGNAVLAKPAEQTPLVAYAAIRLLFEAGIPSNILQFLPGSGGLGAVLVAEARIAGVAFTGSIATAQAIHRRLALRPGPILPLIAETGGINALIADSSALPEQLVADALKSAFDSAGQRCSACRVLFVQNDIAERVITLLTGALALLRLGDPGDLATDIGPVIDSAALLALERHSTRLMALGEDERKGASSATSIRLLAKADLPAATQHGLFFPPQIFELDRLDRLSEEVFGPILHVIRWPGDRLDAVLAAIDQAGFGLTLGIHSRIDETIETIMAGVRVGNIYVNRSMIGAVVGTQPFGGEGLSGTGPKAGGPLTLARYATERVVSIDTTAAGGNAGLLALG